MSHLPKTSSYKIQCNLYLFIYTYENITFNMKNK